MAVLREIDGWAQRSSTQAATASIGINASTGSHRDSPPNPRGPALQLQPPGFIDQATGGSNLLGLGGRLERAPLHRRPDPDVPAALAAPRAGSAPRNGTDRPPVPLLKIPWNARHRSSL